MGPAIQLYKDGFVSLDTLWNILSSISEVLVKELSFFTRSKGQYVFRQTKIFKGWSERDDGSKAGDQHLCKLMGACPLMTVCATKYQQIVSPYFRVFQKPFFVSKC